jgi:hypothetical protein
VHDTCCPNTIVLWPHAKMSVPKSVVTTVAAPGENPFAANDTPIGTCEAVGAKTTEQLVAEPVIVHDEGVNVPALSALKANVSPTEPTAVQLMVVRIGMLFGEQLSGARLAAWALADPPSHATVTISAAITAGQAR